MKDFTMEKVQELLPIIKESIRDGGQFVLYPRGKSMLPTLIQGEDCVVLSELHDIHKYDIVLYRRRKSRRFLLHRIMRVKKGKYTMCGDHQVEFERGIEKDQLIAMVSEIRKGDGRVITLEEIRNAGKEFDYIPYRMIKRQFIRLKRFIKGENIFE